MTRARLLLLSLVLGGCVADADLELTSGRGFPVVEPGSAEEAGMLAFLNDGSTSFELLDVDVGLDRRAAQGIVDRRDGEDGTFGTADDRPFASVQEVDDVPYVGAVALEKILAWAREHGWLETVGVDRDGATLALVNDPATTVELLDVDVALDRRAAQNIVAARDGADGLPGTSDDVPFATIAQLDAVPYVGPSALDKLAAYALANGYGATPPPSSPPCAIFSEYTEGPGNNNKAVEIYNCGSEPLVLDTLVLCLVRNDDTSCTNRSGVGSGALAPGAVRTLCRTRSGTFNDPFANLAAACDFEVGGAATFDGDDRLLLFRDDDADLLLDPGELVLDAFGDPATRPASGTWAEVTLRRCDLTPHAPGPFSAGDYFTTHPRTDYTHLGVPPSQSCGAGHLGGEGDDCLGHEHCAEGLRCYGRPADGSTPYGRCVDPTPIPGEGARCDRWSPCAEGLICAGWTLWGEGDCNPLWMAGRFETRGDAPIHDTPSPGIAPSVVVYGLASVPVDLDVVVHLSHPRPSDLRVTLIDPNGDSSVLWDRSPEMGEWSRSFVLTGSISRDDAVNGRWTLRVEDLVAGQSGTFHGWSLFVTSRWD